MPPTTPVTPDLTSEHDAANRLWTTVGRAHKDLAANQRELGRLFYQLRNLYSERANSAARRLTSGHGVFQIEIKKRGYKPNRIRELICDYEVEIGLRPPAESTAAKRKARRVNSSAEYERGYKAAMNDFPTASREDPLSRFAELLPFTALKTAFRKALHELHPDHGGSEERTKALISAWEDLERLHCSAAAGVVGRDRSRGLVTCARPPSQNPPSGFPATGSPGCSRSMAVRPWHVVSIPHKVIRTRIVS